MSKNTLNLPISVPDDLDEKTVLQRVIIPWLENLLAQARARLRELEGGE